METKDKISFNSMDDHEIHDYVYAKVIRDFNVLYDRNEMGGDEGIHFPKHDPPLQIDPNL
jgi:hypothetical protein